ncbi:cystine/glutamate transporter [Aplysia californica]|uniref:Cystine/glutamate transporter n=1 Tax=Aplysia californica TaxID=6500 RepID=A0ABM0JFW9_APLCA|nr:cystine/glutamate transporter [Aplysia californica]XP_035824215.1 cystine/glutamate transporter [Aplysia californica]
MSSDMGDEKVVVEKETPQMRRSLSLFHVVALLVSITGHVAIFITPGSIVEMSGSVVSTLVIYGIGTFVVYSLALCFAELGTIFQGAGGPYVYLALTFGNIYGFLIAWGYIVLISGPFVAFASQTAALYIIRAIFPNMDCQNKWYDFSMVLLSGWILVTLFYMNCFYLKTLLRIQSILTMCKMVAIGIVIGAGVYIIATQSPENFQKPLEGSVTNPGHISVALLYVIFSNGGWQAVTTLTEEVKNPAQTLPRAIQLTFGINIVLIVLTYIAYMSVLDMSEIVETRAIAILFCQRVWEPLVPVVSALVALACIGALNTGLMGHSRVLYAAARKGDMPSVLGTLHPTSRTPMVAVFAITTYGGVMALTGATTLFMQFIGLYSLIMGLKVVLALLYLRYKKPELSRPYKVPILFPLLQVVVCVGLMFLILVQEPVSMFGGLLIYLAGFPIYWVCVTWKNKPKSFGKAIGKITSVIQKLFVQVPG